MVSPYHGAKIKSHYEVYSSALSGKGPLLSFRPHRPVRVVCLLVCCCFFFSLFWIFHVRVLVIEGTCERTFFFLSWIKINEVLKCPTEINNSFMVGVHPSSLGRTREVATNQIRVRMTLATRVLRYFPSPSITRRTHMNRNQEPMSRSNSYTEPMSRHFLQTDLFLVHLFFCERKAVPQ